MAYKIPENILQYASQRAIELIKEQIAEGIDIEGKPYRYSTRPFARPVSGIPGWGKIKNSLLKSKEIKLFRTKEGKLWVRVEGGYRRFREFTGRKPDGDFLQYSGKMLAALSSSPKSPNKIILGFSTARASEIAFYLNVSGAGRSRRLWRFLGLTKENEQRLADEISALLLQHIFIRPSKIDIGTLDFS